MKRIQSVDAFRFIAVVMVIVLHAQPFRLEAPREIEIYKYIDAIITNAARFAVPSFFAISGYFWGLRIREGHSPVSLSLQRLGRIMLIFLAWCVIYLVPFNMLRPGMGIGDTLRVIADNIDLPFYEPIVVLLMRGTKLHLWYLVTLMYSMSISAIFLQIRMEKGLVFFAIFLYVTGILAKAYEDTPIGISIKFNTLYGPFFGTLFFVTGYLLSGYKIEARWLWYGLVVFAFGSIVHASEVFMIWRKYGELPRQDYVFGTYFMGAGYAMMALSDHPLLRSDLLARMGRMALGLYLSHHIFVDLLAEFNRNHDSLLWEITYVPIVLVLSLLTTCLLSSNRFTRRIIE